MASQDVFVGIDVSTDRLDVHVHMRPGFSVSNEAAGYTALAIAPSPRIKSVGLKAHGGRRRVRNVRGDLERGAQQPCDQRVLSPAVGQRQASQGGAGGVHAQDAGDAQQPRAR